MTKIYCGRCNNQLEITDEDIGNYEEMVYRVHPCGVCRNGISDRSLRCAKACEEVMNDGIPIAHAAKKYKLWRQSIRSRLKRMGYPPLQPGRPANVRR